MLSEAVGAWFDDHEMSPAARLGGQAVRSFPAPVALLLGQGPNAPDPGTRGSPSLESSNPAKDPPCRISQPLFPHPQHMAFIINVCKKQKDYLKAKTK